MAQYGEDYRQLQSPEQVRTDLPDSGAAARAAELHQAFTDFEGEALGIHNTLATKAGAIAGAASGDTGHPQYKAGLSQLTAYGRAFNNAATGAYTVQAEAQADDAAARLRVQANNDPKTFSATYSAARDAAIKEAPVNAQGALTEMWNKRLAEGMAAISGDQATEIQGTQRNAWDEGIQRQVSRVANLRGSANPDDQKAADDEQVKLDLLVQGGANSGLYSQAQAESRHIIAMRDITKQVFETQVDRELSKPDGDPIKLVENFRQMHLDNLADTKNPQVLTEKEFQDLEQAATTKIREQRLAQLYDKSQGKSAEDIKFEAGDRLYTEKLLSGQLSSREIADAVRTGDLKPEIGRSMQYQLERGDQTKSDPQSVYKLHTDPRFLSMTTDEIVNYPGVNWKDKLEAVKDQEKRNNGWEGTSQAKEAKATIDNALKIRSGEFVSDDQRREQSQAQLEYIQQMNALDPAKRAGAAVSVANGIIAHIKQQDAGKEVTGLQSARSNYIATYGPGGKEQADDATYQKRLKYYDTMIQQKSTEAKGN